MEAPEIIQTLIFLTMAASVVFMGIQTRLQNKVMQAQLLRDRLDLYWKTYEPVTEEQVQHLHANPEDYYLKPEEYAERYRGNTARVKRLIQMSMLYEYMAFTHELESLKIGDPLGREWMERWTRQLISDEEFLTVHRNFHGFYPHYEKYVDQIRSERPTQR